ncbi:hypothetical protein [Baaleninema sp.]|uniref:hypothetical protein n=1 Tax=Baaleninema sp. TaxID=3101197 RepID=UPI003CFBF011
MLRQFLAIALVVTSLFVATPRASYAGELNQNYPSNYYIENYETSSNILQNCWNGEPKNMLEKIVCESIEGGAVMLGSAGVAVGICYAADALASAVFPPAAALAPVCSTAGVASLSAASGSSNLVGKGIKAFAH